MTAGSAQAQPQACSVHEVTLNDSQGPRLKVLHADSPHTRSGGPNPPAASGQYRSTWCPASGITIATRLSLMLLRKPPVEPGMCG